MRRYNRKKEKYKGIKERGNKKKEVI